jgi:hypothetical protein
MADAEPAGYSAHCFPARSDGQLQDCSPELRGAGPLDLVAEEHFPEHRAVALSPAEHCCSRGRPVAALLHPDVERYCPVIPEAGLQRRGEQAEHSPARRVAEHLPAPLHGCFPVRQVVRHSLEHWLAHALRCFPVARVVPHLPVHYYPVLAFRRALLAAEVVPARPGLPGQFSPEVAQDVRVLPRAVLAGSESWAAGLPPPAGSSLAVEAQLAQYEPRPSRFGVAAGCFSQRRG